MAGNAPACHFTFTICSTDARACSPVANAEYSYSADASDAHLQTQALPVTGSARWQLRRKQPCQRLVGRGGGGGVNALTCSNSGCWRQTCGQAAEGRASERDEILHNVVLA
jgi:hypothetical protein